MWLRPPKARKRRLEKVRPGRKRSSHPSPPDAPVPDQGTTTDEPPKSAAKRTLNRLDPHCIDVIFHSCWSSPAAESGQARP